MSTPEKARENALPLLRTDQARDKLVMDLLALAHTGGKIPDQDTRIEQIWFQRFGVPFFPYKPTATVLRGFPGHGKTTAYFAAASEVAQRLGMDLVFEPEEPCEIGPNTLLIKTINLSGEVSNTAVSGIPQVGRYQSQDGREAAYTHRAPPFALAAAKYAGLAVVVGDDYNNAAPNIQNILNDLLDRGRAQGVDLGPRCLVGATGNLGAEDGANVHGTSTATATRTNSYMVEDVLEDWAQRTIAQYPDAIGDAGLAAFLESMPDLFHKPTRSKKGEPYPSPRTWSRCLQEHLRPFYAQVQHPAVRDNSTLQKRVLEDVMQRAAGLIGTAAADKLRTYYASVLDESLPLAREVLTTGQLTAKSQKRFAEKYGSGAAAEETTFLRQFYVCLVDESAKELVDAYLQGDHARFAKRFDAVLNGLYKYSQDASQHGWVAHYLSSRMVALSGQDPKIGIVRAQTNGVEVSLPLMDAMTKVAAKNSGACATTDGKKTLFDATFLSALTGMDAMQAPDEELLAAGPASAQSAPTAAPPPAAPTAEAPAPTQETAEAPTPPRRSPGMQMEF